MHSPVSAIRSALVLLLFVAGISAGSSTSVTFTSRELFRVPFGDSRDTLSAHVEGSNFIIPRGFTMDETGHFYIYDSNRHRIARFSAHGRFEIEFRYVASADQVFAHPDAQQNLWLLVSDPSRGIYYGVYDTHGKRLRDALFSRFNHFQLHVGDDYALHVIFSASRDPSTVETWFFDEASLRMTKEDVARPPRDHHQVRKDGRVYMVDAVPGAPAEQAASLTRIREASQRGGAEILGTVVYVTQAGDIYTRVGNRDIRVYDVNAKLKGHVMLQGLRSSCASVRFDSDGNMYELDGIPDLTDAQVRQRIPDAAARSDFEDLHYTPGMPGMRILQWERHS